MAAPSSGPSVPVTIRSATNGDLSVVHDLILESFRALVEFTGEESRATYEHYGRLAATQDLKDIEASYLQSRDSHFWVAEVNGTVVGCVGLRRGNAEDGVLGRMAVLNEMRCFGIGSELVKTLFTFARSRGYLRITLLTGNPRAANFYKKMNFISFAETPFGGKQSK